MRTTLRAATVSGLLTVALTAVAMPADAGIASPSPSRRVDLEHPVFTNPTHITNPLFPIASTDQGLMLGAEGDVGLRQEVTLLDHTRTIRWAGQDIEAVVSQFVAQGDGRIVEVATDYFAQADDGSVWYLGEDVTTYEDGLVTGHAGSWLAGRDGPGGMIMPAHPEPGDVYRPENIPGLVLEETTVLQIDLTVEGPTGEVHGAILVQERPMGGDLEQKLYAPGYGEFTASVPASFEAVATAVAIPTDAIGGGAPPAVDRLADSAGALYDTGAAGSWSDLAGLAGDARQALESLAAAAEVPPLLDDQATGALDAVDGAIGRRSRAELREAAVELQQATLDLQMQYEDIDVVDVGRVGAWQRQEAVDRAAGDAGSVRSDRVIIATILDRISG